MQGGENTTETTSSTDPVQLTTKKNISYKQLEVIADGFGTTPEVLMNCGHFRQLPQLFFRLTIHADGHHDLVGKCGKCTGKVYCKKTYDPAEFKPSSYCRLND